MPTDHDLERYRANIRAEQDSSALYQLLANAEREPHLAAVYQRMADAERRHAAIWAERLRQAGAESTVAYTPSWRIRVLGWLARRFGSGFVLPIISSMERNAIHTYGQQSEAHAVGIINDERSHARVFRLLRTLNTGTISGQVLAQLERRHRGAGGGNALRAAVLGASDGLTSNLSLVMGVAGADLAGHTILITGLAGLLAGASSMAIGEWLSVQSARELAGSQIEIERQELAEIPEEEQEELALIYQAKGLDAEAADRLAKRIIGEGGAALETLAHEELGLDPKELGGSAWVAAITSFLLFAVGAIVPVIPFAFGGGLVPLAVSLALSVLGLFLIGVGITLTTGTPLLKAGGRQVLLGLLAAAVTFGVGWLVGGRFGEL